MTVSSIKVKIQRKSIVKLKVLPKFPANVVAENFLTVTRSGGTYTFSVDYSVLTPGPISDPTTAYVAISDTTSGIYKTVTLSSLLTSGLDADLQAIAALTGTGILARTASNTWVLRTITGTANEITVTNGDGVSGAPTLSLPTALTFTGKTVTGGTFTGVTITSATYSGTLAGGTGLPISTGVSGLGTGIATALGVNVGTAGSPVINGGALGTPSSGTLTSATGLPISTGVSGLASGAATFLATPSSANLRALLTDEVGTGAAYFVGGALGTPASGTATNLTGLPLSSGITGAGTGVLTALAVNVGTSGSVVVNGGVLGTPSSGTATNLTGLPLAGLVAQAAYTFVGNNTGSSAVPTAVDIAALTAKASPAATDLVLLSDQAASGAWKKATVSSISSAGSVSSIAGNTGAFTLGVGLTNSVNDIRSVRPKILTFTFDISLTTNFSVTGVGFAPRAAFFLVVVPAGVGQFAFGYTDGTTSGEVHGRGTIGADTMGIDTSVFDIIVSSGNLNVVSLVSLDSDGFTFSRAKTGSPTGTATVNALIFA